MTDNHTELCKKLREEIALFKVARINPGQIVPALAMIEQQAARIQQQAARIAELEKEKDEAEKHAAVVSSESFDLEARIAELEADRDSWRDQASQRVADWDEMRKERDALKADAERYDFLRCRAELREYSMGLNWYIKTVDVPMGMPLMDATLANVIDAAIQAAKETRS